MASSNSILGLDTKVYVDLTDDQDQTFVNDQDNAGTAGAGTSYGGFTKIAGGLTTTIRIVGQVVDVTNSCSEGRWRELTEGAGVSSIDIGLVGTFRNQEHMRFVYGQVKDAISLRCVIQVSEFGVLHGSFRPVNLGFVGAFDGDVGFQTTLISDGVINRVDPPAA